MLPPVMQTGDHRKCKQIGLNGKNSYLFVFTQLHAILRFALYAISDNLLIIQYQIIDIMYTMSSSLERAQQAVRISATEIPANAT